MVIGTAIGVLPGIGPIPTVALLLPFTFGLEPASSSLIMLAGIFYGAQYGGSTTAILVNVPGETSSVVTCLDGHEMAKQGRAGPALAIAAISSFFAGNGGDVVIAVSEPALGRSRWNSRRWNIIFRLLVLGLFAAGHPRPWLSVAKSLAMVLLGLMIGTVGIDVNSGIRAHDLRRAGAGGRIGFRPVAMGLFGLAEIMANLERPETRQVVSQKLRDLVPSWPDLKAAFPAMARGHADRLRARRPAGRGRGAAALHGLSRWKRSWRADPSRFGKGAIEGVAGPEAANNAGAQTSFIPLLTLAIPANALMALMIGALMMQGIQPGPQVMTEQPQLVWGVIRSMWTGNSCCSSSICRWWGCGSPC